MKLITAFIIYLFSLSCGVLHASLGGLSNRVTAGLKPWSINNFNVTFSPENTENSHQFRHVSCSILCLPAHGSKVLNSRTLGKFPRPRLLLSGTLSPEVDSWLCSGTSGLTFDLAWIQGIVFAERITVRIRECEFKQHTGGSLSRVSNVTFQTVSLPVSSLCILQKMQIRQNLHAVHHSFWNHTWCKYSQN